MASEPLIGIRAAIKQMMLDLSGHDNDSAFSLFEAKHRELLDNADRDLRRLGFIKMMNDVGGRSKKILENPNQSELFPEMRRPQMIVVPIYKNGKISARKRVAFDGATLAEIQAWRKLNSAHREQRPDQYKKVDDAIALLLKHTSDTSLTFAEASKLAEAAEAKTA